MTFHPNRPVGITSLNIHSGLDQIFFIPLQTKGLQVKKYATKLWNSLLWKWQLPAEIQNLQELIFHFLCRQFFSAITVFYAASLHHNCLSTAWSTAICHLNTSALDSTKADFLFFFLLEWVAIIHSLLSTLKHHLLLTWCSFFRQFFSWV